MTEEDVKEEVKPLSFDEIIAIANLVTDWDAAQGLGSGDSAFFGFVSYFRIEISEHSYEGDEGLDSLTYCHYSVKILDREGHVTLGEGQSKKHAQGVPLEKEEQEKRDKLEQVYKFASERQRSRDPQKIETLKQELIKKARVLIPK